MMIGKWIKPDIFASLPVSVIICCMTMFAGSCSQGDQSHEAAASVDQGNPSGSRYKPLRKVRLMPYWVAAAQFSGYYMGIEKGIFRKHGIDLEILPFDPFRPTKKEIEDGRADFALLWLVNAIELRSQGVEIVNIAQLSSRSSLMLLAKKSSGIRTIGDLNGKKAAIWAGFELQPRALFAKYGLNVQMTPIGSTNTLFLLDGVDVINANWFDEYHAILNNGYDTNELVPLFFEKYGLNFLEDGIYCLSAKTRSDPGLCWDFTEAVLESWMYAFDHPEETLDVVIRIAKKQSLPVNRSHQRWMLDCYRELYIPKGQHTINTVLRISDYLNVSRIMLQSKLIRNTVPYKDFFIPFRSLNPKAMKEKNEPAYAE